MKFQSLIQAMNSTDLFYTQFNQLELMTGQTGCLALGENGTGKP